MLKDNKILLLIGSGIFEGGRIKDAGYRMQDCCAYQEGEAMDTGHRMQDRSAYKERCKGFRTQNIRPLSLQIKEKFKDTRCKKQGRKTGIA